MIEEINKKDDLWDRFCRKEEYNSPKKDRFGRFPFSESTCQNILEPAVSKHLVENGFKMEYGQGRKFAVCLTHDVDILGGENLVKLGLRSLRTTVSGNMRGAPNRLWTSLSNGTYLDVKNIMAIEDRFGARSSFYFLAVEKSSPDFFYNIEGISETLDHVVKGGWEVGLHGSQAAHDNLEQMRSEKRALEGALGRPVVGYRNHFLRFNMPLTWRLLCQAGFKYDTTLGFADSIGFRNGMCHPFKPFDLETNSSVDLVELPLVIMDRTLFDDYMRFDMPRAWEMVKELIDTVERYNGVLTILWHNNSMHGEQLRFYEKVLKYCYERNAWMTSGKNIIETVTPWA